MPGSVTTINLKKKTNRNKYLFNQICIISSCQSYINHNNQFDLSKLRPMLIQKKCNNYTRYNQIKSILALNNNISRLPTKTPYLKQSTDKNLKRDSNCRALLIKKINSLVHFPSDGDSCSVIFHLIVVRKLFPYEHN